MQCAVYAMANFPSLKNVLIIPRSPRTDEELLADVSEYGNDMLVSQIASTGLSSIKRWNLFLVKLSVRKVISLGQGITC